MLKDVAHADVAKNETIDDADANYDDYYDVSRAVFVCLLSVSTRIHQVLIHLIINRSSKRGDEFATLIDSLQALLLVCWLMSTFQLFFVIFCFRIRSLTFMSNNFETWCRVE